VLDGDHPTDAHLANGLADTVPNFSDIVGKVGGSGKDPNNSSSLSDLCQ
jgi:hypothetical protein